VRFASRLLWKPRDEIGLRFMTAQKLSGSSYFLL
jgi:hypothetical protein